MVHVLEFLLHKTRMKMFKITYPEYLILSLKDSVLGLGETKHPDEAELKLIV